MINSYKDANKLDHLYTTDWLECKHSECNVKVILKESEGKFHDVLKY